MQNRWNPTGRFQPPVQGNLAPAAQHAAATQAAAACAGPSRPRREIHIHLPAQRNSSPIEPLLINHQVLYCNTGLNPGPCNICLMQRQPQNIYLRHCIPRCPALVLPYRLYFATSDFIAPNEIRPHVMYQLGMSYVSNVPGGYHLVQPVILGVFNATPQVNAVMVPTTPANDTRSGSSQGLNSSVQNRWATASGNRALQHRIRMANSRRVRYLHSRPSTSFPNRRN